MGNYREFIKDKKRIVIKIGSSSLMHEQTGRLDLLKIEKLVRILIDIKNSGKDVVLVSSGAIAVGRAVIGLNDRPTELPVKQACASIGQAKLMMVYQLLMRMIQYQLMRLNSFRLLEIMTDFQQLLLQLSGQIFLFCYLILTVCIQMIRILILMQSSLRLYMRLMISLWEWAKAHPAVIWGLAV